MVKIMWLRLKKACRASVELRWVVLILSIASAGLLLECMIYVFVNTSTNRDDWTPADNVVGFVDVWSPMLILIPSLTLVVFAWLTFAWNRRMKQQNTLRELMPYIKEWRGQTYHALLKVRGSVESKVMESALGDIMQQAARLQELRDQVWGLPKKLDKQMEVIWTSLYDVIDSGEQIPNVAFSEVQRLARRGHSELEILHGIIRDILS